MRLIHLLVIGALVFAAAHVYRIKMESTARTERVLQLRAEIREQRDAIALLHSQWAKLDAPLRLQGLVERHLPLKPINAMQFDGHTIQFQNAAFNRDLPQANAVSKFLHRSAVRLQT